jgi:cbb3-type cytochrome oxidase subunit 3
VNRSWLLLGITLGLLGLLVAIAARAYRRGHREEAERPKYRMLEDD